MRLGSERRPRKGGARTVELKPPTRICRDMVSHDLESLRTVCDRIAALDDRSVIAVGAITDKLHAQHPWIKAYFQRKRGHMLARAPSLERA